MKYTYLNITIGLIFFFCTTAWGNEPEKPDTPRAAASQPHVVFVLTDDQGYGPMRCHGDENIKTPELDRLFRESTRFTNFHVQPNCAPTRALLMTGRSPLRNGVWATIRGRSLLRRGETTVAESFKASGYKTAIFGKWHLGDNYPFRPQDRGFEEVLVHGCGGVGNILDYWANNYFDDHYQHNGVWKKYHGYCTDVWFDEAMKYIDRNRDKPFFVYISTNAPHLPLEVPTKYTDLYRENKTVQQKPGIAEFYGMITNIDDNMGRLRAKLKELKLDRNTILIFMSDNGTTRQFATWNAGMSGGKGSVLDGGHRVPFFVHWPEGGLARGRDIDALTSGFDLRPTLEELCSLQKAAGAPDDGKSLLPLLKGQTPKWIDRTICLDLQRQQRTPKKENPHTVMQGQWRWTMGKLYNLTDDPGQLRDVKGKYPRQAQKMQAEYDRWWEEMSQHDPDAGHDIIIGSDKENPCKLTTHDISDMVAWNHDQVLAGVKTSGFWDVEVAKEGEYEFALRRYPIEADAPILGTISVPERLRNFRYFSRHYEYAIKHERSKALDVVSASVKIGSFQEQKKLPAQATNSTDYTINDKGQVLAVKFTAKLKADKYKLEAWFSDEKGESVTSAYYVYVTRL